MDRREKIFVFLLGIIYLMPILRIVLDAVIGNYTLVTIIIYPVLVTMLLIINGGMKIKVRFWTWIFIIYTVIISMFHIIAGTSSFVQAASSVLRFVILALSLNYVSFSNPSESGAYKVVRYSLLFFAFTIVCSLIQVFQWMPLHNLLLTAGGNIVSSTALNNIRVNGAVGGTVIAYGVYIVLCCFIILFGHTKLEIVGKGFFLIGIIAAMFMNYSRACFIGVVIAFAGYYFLAKFRELKTMYKLISIFLVIGLVWWYFATDNIMVRYMFQDDIYRSVSDGKRIKAAIAGLTQMDTFPKKMFGISVGKNTGFSSGGKLLGDGAVVSFLLDYGVTGLLIAIAFVSEIIQALKARATNKRQKNLIILMFFDWFVMLIINSGFLENINIMMFAYPIYLYVYKVSREEKEDMSCCYEYGE